MNFQEVKEPMDWLEVREFEGLVSLGYQGRTTFWLEACRRHHIGRILCARACAEADPKAFFGDSATDCDTAIEIATDLLRELTAVSDPTFWHLLLHPLRAVGPQAACVTSPLETAFGWFQKPFDAGATLAGCANLLAALPLARSRAAKANEMHSASFSPQVQEEMEIKHPVAKLSARSPKQLELARRLRANYLLLGYSPDAILSVNEAGWLIDALKWPPIYWLPSQGPHECLGSTKSIFNK